MGRGVRGDREGSERRWGGGEGRRVRGEGRRGGREERGRREESCKNSAYWHLISNLQ